MKINESHGACVSFTRTDHAHLSDLPFYFSRELWFSGHLHFIDNFEKVFH